MNKGKWGKWYRTEYRLMNVCPHCERGSFYTSTPALCPKCGNFVGGQRGVVVAEYLRDWNPSFRDGFSPYLPRAERALVNKDDEAEWLAKNNA